MSLGWYIAFLGWFIVVTAKLGHNWQSTIAGLDSLDWSGGLDCK